MFVNIRNTILFFKWVLMIVMGRVWCGLLVVKCSGLLMGNKATLVILH